MHSPYVLSPDALIDRAAGGSLERALRAGAIAYRRDRDLPRPIRLDPFAPATDDLNAAERIVARLESALRGERNRARSGHWTYDLNRHIALRQAHCAELERLDLLRRAGASQVSVKTVSKPKTGSRTTPDQSM